MDDRPLMEAALRTQMRDQWPQRYGPRLETLLRLSRFSAAPEAFIRQTIELAQWLLGDSAHETLVPDPSQINLDRMWTDARSCAMALKTLCAEPPGLVAGYQRLNINARTKTALLRDVVTPIAETLEPIVAETFRLDDLIPLATALKARHSSGETQLARLVPQKWLKAGENLAVCPHLEAIQKGLERLLNIVETLSYVLMLDAVVQLRLDLRRIKARNGWISYQDMLTRVAEFMQDPGAENGIQAIRERYRVAFVDEFQDTDVLQWRIFRTLFLDGAAAGGDNRLFLIGDPKQAIYGFRGADVFTYLAARQEMIRLCAQDKARLYALTTNYRSLPEMVAAHNHLFAATTWFGGESQATPFTIGYTPVGSPPSDQLPLRVIRDRSGRPPLNIVDLSEARSHGDAKRLLAGFICQEIRHLVGQGDIRLAPRSGNEHDLHFGDIAILVRSQTEFGQIEPLLTEWQIPYAYYRKPGLFQSLQAHWLAMLLRAVAHPQVTAAVRLALLTPFFDMSADLLATLPDLPPEHPGQQLLGRWYHLAQQRRWGPLFQSFMEDSGLILRHCTDPGWDRMETNFQQLFDYLELSAYSKNLDVSGMVTLLDRLRQDTGQRPGDADIHQIEDEESRVQVLTMHVSKGLEFPVVFIAGGLTERGEGPVKVYHQIDSEAPRVSFRKVIDLTGKTGGEAAGKEYQDENKRLYYVALTRSQVKLYIPFYPSRGNHHWIGPVCRFVAPSIEAVMGAAAAGGTGKGWHAAIRQTGSPPAPEQSVARAEGISLPAGRFLPQAHDYRQRKIDLTSFSGIVHKIDRLQLERQATASAFSVTAAVAKDTDEPPLDHALDSAGPDSTETDPLPGGTQMGSMFHFIFENIDFPAVHTGPAEILDHRPTADLVAAAMQRYRIAPQWTQRIASVVANVLRAPIELEGSTLILGSLPPDRRRHEIEFFFPLAHSLPPSHRIPGCQWSPDTGQRTLIRGFVDLIFEWQGRFYIADWKSNLLTAGYDRETMAREMMDAGYTLQYQLYSVATLRWLAQLLGDRFDPQRHFGGVLYFFIRGMLPGGQQGVFHIPGRQLLPLETLETAIHAQIAENSRLI
ncbi:UvrD-helicase domain-containing protein [Desulfosarcina cetonica]|uniref:UvrD-helicase domain-containing protein n=1 Tax=Desulfosarcina cetonica TaxID=90730 RepID=UPI0012EDED3B|nr:UvrD-helicase domain-containing protein [Desulfosarcina cetonica]